MSTEYPFLYPKVRPYKKKCVKYAEFRGARARLCQNPYQFSTVPKGTIMKPKTMFQKAVCVLVCANARASISVDSIWNRTGEAVTDTE